MIYGRVLRYVEKYRYWKRITAELMYQGVSDLLWLVGGMDRGREDISRVGSELIEVHIRDSTSIEMRILKSSLTWRVVEDMLGESS